MREQNGISMRLTRSVLALSLLTIAVFCVVFVHASLKWPLVGDASVMHYVVFLIQHGEVPYRQIRDINMPGAYASEYLAMRVFGTGALAWRLYDLFLVALLTTAMVVVAGSRRRWAGFFAGGLFLLLHGRDGLAELGQRDLTAAVLLMIGCALLLYPRQARRTTLRVGACGFCLGLVLLIKPTLIWAGAAFLIAIVVEDTPASERAKRAWMLLLGACIPVMSCLLVLWRWHALKAFLTGAFALAGYYAALARKPFAYFLLHLVPSSLLPMTLLGLAILLLQYRKTATPHTAILERKQGLLLSLCLLAGVVSFVLQGKALPYHRYPANAFLLLIAALCFQSAMQQRALVRALGIAGCVAGALILAPLSTARTLHYSDGDRSFRSMLSQDLVRLGGSPPDSNLNRDVQCIDFTAGCTNTLYDLRLVESTGTLSDCFLFGPETNAAVRNSRQQFMEEYLPRHPRIVVVSNQDCYRPNSYDKLLRWPEFYQDLQTNYVLLLDRPLRQPIHWTSTVVAPYSYRIYELRSAAGTQKAVAQP